MKDFYDRMKKKNYQLVGKYKLGDDTEKILKQLSDKLIEEFGITMKYELYNNDVFIRITKPKDVE